MVTPDIGQIVKQSLRIGKVLMFYLARSIDINELFDIIYEETKEEFIYLDTYILESANKTKAILALYGSPADLLDLKDDIGNFISLISQKEIKLIEDLEKSELKKNKLEEELDYVRTVISMSKNNYYNYNNSTNSTNNSNIKSLNDNDSELNESKNSSNTNNHSKEKEEKDKNRRKLSSFADDSKIVKSKYLRNNDEKIKNNKKTNSLDNENNSINLFPYSNNLYNIEAKMPEKINTIDERSKEELIKILEVIGIKDFCNVLLKYKDRFINNYSKDLNLSNGEIEKIKSSNILNILTGKVSLKEIVNFYYSENLNDKQLTELLCPKS